MKTIYFYLSIIAICLIGCSDDIKKELELNNDCLLSRSVTTNPFTEEAQEMLDELPKTIYYLNTYVHVIRSSAGVGETDLAGVSSNIIDNLNDSFLPHSIFFRLMGSQYIDSDIYNDCGQNNADTIFDNSLYRHDNAIDIFVYTNKPKFSTVIGQALRFDLRNGCAFWVTSDSLSTSTLTHEMGHTLGLYHTFRGTAETGGTPELVNGYNGWGTGDEVRDTPADPNITKINSYAYGGNTSNVDANGDVYAPDVTNYMSYYRPRDHFTVGQEMKMRKHLQNSTWQAKNMVYTGNLISGKTFMNSTSTYTLNLPEQLLDNSTVNWTVKMKAYSNTQNDTINTTTYYTGKTLALTQAGSDYPSQKYTIKATVTDSRGYKITTEEKNIHFIRTNVACGYYRWQSVRSGSSLSGTTIGSTAIRTRPGDVLYLWYIDELGGSSTTYTSEYSFMIMGNMTSYFQKRSNNSFYCAENTALGSTNITLQTTVCGLSNMISLPINIVSTSTLFNLPEDSLEFSIDSISFANESLDIEL